MAKHPVTPLQNRTDHRRSFAVVIVAGVALAGALLLAGTQAATAPIRIMPLGDSITEGMHNTQPAQDGGYRHVLNDNFDRLYPGKYDFVGSLSIDSAGMSDPNHEGHSGYRTDQILSGVSGWVGSYKPDIILLHIGTNDVLQQKTAAQMTANVNGILDKIYAAQPGATVILASMIPMWGPQGWTSTAWTQYNAAVPGIVSSYKAKGRSIIFADMGKAGLQTGAADLPDGVHPNNSGYAKMAAIWQPLIVAASGGGSGVTPTPAGPTATPTRTPTPTATPAPTPAGTGSVNDSGFNYLGSWQTSSNAGTFGGDDHYSDSAGASYSLNFTGSQARLYLTKAPHHGIAAVSIDGGAETMVDAYAATRADQQLAYTSPALASGTHTIKVRVTGTKNAASTGQVVNADRIDVVATASTPTATPVVTATPTPAATKGDLNRDGRVNALDLSVLLSNWGKAGGDLNGDGTTGILDLSELISNWGK